MSAIEDLRVAMLKNENEAANCRSRIQNLDNERNRHEQMAIIFEREALQYRQALDAVCQQLGLCEHGQATQHDECSGPKKS